MPRLALQDSMNVDLGCVLLNNGSPVDQKRWVDRLIVATGKP